MWELIQKGGPVMYPLLVCSFVSLTFIIERLLFWFLEVRGEDSKKLDQAMDHLRSGDRKAFFTACQNSRDPVARVLARSRDSHGKTLRESLAIHVEDALEKTTRSLNIIDTVVTLSPLLGIFGTVTGIIQSFDLLGAHGISDPHAVSRGIAQALITTATGLAIAMPSLIFHNYFVTRSERFGFRLEKYAREFEILISQVNEAEASNKETSFAKSV